MGIARTFDTLGKQKAIIGMVHLGPMPGTPFYEEGSYAAVKERAVADGVALYKGGATGCLVQTIDQVYSTVDEADPARIAAVSNIVYEIARSTGPAFQIGVQILRNAIQASLAVAKVSGGSFLRCGALVGATMTGDGLMDSDPMAVAEYRRRLNAMDIKLIAEVHSMHFKALDDTSPVEIAKNAVRVGADAVSLGDPDERLTLEMVREVREALPDTPIFLAGYTNHDNAARLLPAVDGAYVGTCLEKSGWGSAIDEGRVRAYMDIVSSAT
jgi:membrane complex biogenesis BtpA family protein